MRWLRENVFNNFKLKLLALAVSLTLWAIYTREPFAEVAYNVPITYLNVPAGLAIAGNTPTTVHVLIRGRSGLLRRLISSDLNFNLDLLHAQAGDDTVRVTDQMVHVPYGTEVVEITPLQFRVVLVTNQSPRQDAE